MHLIDAEAAPASVLRQNVVLEEGKPLFLLHCGDEPLPHPSRLARAETDIERQTLRLHAANILLKQAKPEQANVLLLTVTAPELQGQKQKLVAPPAETEKK
jgi:hypothetical protein